MDPSLFLQSKLNESPPFCSFTLAALLQQDWLPIGRLYKCLEFAYFAIVEAFLLLLTVSYLAHRNQTFTMHDHINDRERSSLAFFLQVQIYHKIKTSNTYKYFKFFKFPLLSNFYYVCIPTLLAVLFLLVLESKVTILFWLYSEYKLQY